MCDAIVLPVQRSGTRDGSGPSSTCTISARVQNDTLDVSYHARSRLTVGLRLPQHNFVIPDWYTAGLADLDQTPLTCERQRWLPCASRNVPFGRGAEDASRASHRLNRSATLCDTTAPPLQPTDGPLVYHQQQISPAACFLPEHCARFARRSETNCISFWFIRRSYAGRAHCTLVCQKSEHEKRTSTVSINMKRVTSPNAFRKTASLSQFLH